VSMFTTPRTQTAGSGEELTKEDLLGALIIISVDDFNPQTATKFGTSATLLATVTVVDGPLAGTVEPRFYCAGNLARQIGNGLDVGQMAPGRIVKGLSAGGREWFGVEWATTVQDLEAAEAAMRPLPAAPAKPAPVPLRDQIRADTARRTLVTANQPADTDMPF
jgi:hypothetical protein